MAITLQELAEIAGVSVATVSRALTNSEHPMNPETRQRIIKLAHEQGYQPNLLARSLRKDHSFTIGVLVEDILSPIVPPMLRGIQDTLAQPGYFSNIIHTGLDPQAELEAIRTLNSRQIDGFIFVATWHRSIQAIEETTSKPYVFVHRHFDSYCPNSIVTDEVWGARTAVQHLVQLGHRRIALISGPVHWDASIYRLKGYQQELAACGLDFDPALVVEGDWTVESGYRHTRQLLLLPQRPTAIFASNDLMALGAIYAAQDAGLNVPRDLAVVGYDDRDFSSFIRPTLTTIYLPCYEMGVQSAQTLLKMIKGELRTISALEVRGKLIIRQSCGADPALQTRPEDEIKVWDSRRTDPQVNF